MVWFILDISVVLFLAKEVFIAEKALEAGFENFLGVTGIDPWAEAIEDEMFMCEGYNTV